jgi:hypothetical protein
MVLFIVESKERINFKLIGDNPITVKLNEDYKDPGFILESCRRNNCEKIEKDISVTSDVDNKTIGDYTIEYQYKKKDKEYRLLRTVRVKDSVPPELTLKGKKSIFLCPKEEYKEEGFTAKDNYDGDITKPG